MFVGEIQELFCINTRGSSGGSSSKIMTNQSTSLTGGTNMPNSLFSSSMSSSSTSANPRSFPRSNGALSKFTGTGSISGVNETKSTSVVCILSLHRMYTSLNSSDNNSVWNMFPVENPVSTFSSYLTSAISVVPSTIYSVAGVVAGIGNAESANIGAAEGIDSQNGLSIEENRDPNDVGSVSYGNPVSQIKRGPKVVSSAKPTAAQSPVNQYRGQIEDVVWWNLNIS